MAVLLLKCDHTVDEHVALRATLQRPEKFHHLGIAAHPVHRLAVHVTPGAKQEAGRLDHVNLGLTGTGARLLAPAFRQAASSGFCYGRPDPMNPSLDCRLQLSPAIAGRSEEPTFDTQPLMRMSHAVV